MRRLATGGFIALCLLAANGPAFSAPVLTDLTLRGFQVGKPTVITLRGRDLLPQPQLVLGAPIAHQEIVGKPTEAAVTLQVTVSEKAIPGLYNLRLATGGGISPSVVAAVDALPQQEFAPELKSLPVALHGKVQGSAVVRTSFKGKQGQQLVIEAEAQRLGSKLRPVLHLYDARRRQLGLALPQTTLAGDARLEVTLPTDGTYAIEMHDLEHAAPAPGHYRLKVGSFHFADMAYPPVVSSGTTTNLRLLGNIPPETRVEITPSNLVDSLPAPWPTGFLTSGMRPRVAVSSTRELVEESFSPGPRLLGTLPVAVSGKLEEAGQVDEYQLVVSEGNRLRFEVFADRLGSPIDASLSLHGDKGNTLASNDDNGMSADPLIDYTVPRGVELIQVRVSDLLETGGPTSVYRLAITSLDQGQAGFRLRLLSDSYSVPQETHRIITVLADRQGYAGPIQLTWNQLPPGIDADAHTIPAGASGALLTLKGVGKQTLYGMPTLRGDSVLVEPALSGIASFEGHPLASLQPWLKMEVAVALAERPSAAFQAEWNGLKPDASLVLGKPFPAPVKITRPPGSVGSVQLSVLVGQNPPLNNGRPDPNRTIQGEKPTVVLPVDPKIKAAADALAAAEAALAKLKETEKDPKILQAAQDKKTQAEKALLDLESKQKNDTSFNIVVPVNVEETACDVAIKAELLGPDNRTVVSETYTSVRRLQVVNPLQITLSDGGKYRGVLDPKTGATIDIKGTIDRDRIGFAGEVTLTVAGQPAGVAAPRVVVKAGEKDFTLSLKFPPSNPPGEIANVKLSASGPPDPKIARNVVKTELPLTLNLQRAP